MFLSGERRTEGDHVVRERVLLERNIGAVLEDVAELVRVVGREDDLFLAKARLDTGVEEIGEFSDRSRSP